MATAAIAPGWLGDVVMAAPALKALASAAGDGGLDIFAIEPLAPLIRELLPAREVIPYKKARGFHRLRLQTELSRLLVRGSYETAVLLPNSFSSALDAWRAGVPRSVGTAMHGRSMLLSTRVERMRAEEHQMNAYARIVEAATGTDVTIDKDAKTIDVTDATRERTHELLSQAGVNPTSDRFVALAPGAAYGPAKQWGAAKFAQVARLLDAEGIRSVIVGTPRDTPEAADIILASAKATPVDLTGKTTIVELAGILASATCFAGNDSGGAHLAAALGVPTCAIFLSTIPKHTAQRGPKVTLFVADVECRPCMRRECPSGSYRCRDAVAPEEVARACLGAV